MAKQNPKKDNAKQEPLQGALESTQPVQDNQETSKETLENTEQIDETTQEGVNKGGDQTEQQGDKEGAKNTQEPKDTGMDSKGKGEAANRKGSNSKNKTDIKSDIEKIAKKTFDKHAIDVLYFTSDLLGFGTPQDASHHANNLDDKTVFEVKRESDGK